MSKPAKNRSSAPAPAWPERVMIVTATGRQRLAWRDRGGAILTGRRPWVDSDGLFNGWVAS